jgi:oligopeptide/dipeptide ABC transporter ATP-binding protein
MKPTLASDRAVPASDTLLLVRDLNVRYPVRRSITERLRRAPERWVRAVDGISFTVHRGEMLALVGESGCGKTTTAQAILGMVQPSSGSIEIDGIDLARLSTHEMRPIRRRMQMIYQDPYESLNPRFRVRNTIEEPMIVHGVGGSAEERRQRIVSALTQAGLTPPELFLERYPHELSGGQRQRVAIGASLVLDPELLVADEPVSMLDVSVRAGILSLLDRLRREADMGVLMITHDLSTAANFADQIAVMYLGRIVEYGPARQVIDDARHPYTQALLSVVPKRDPRQRSPWNILRGETPNAVQIPLGCRFHGRCPIGQERCTQVDPKLRPPAEAGADGHEVACLLR